MALLDAGGSEHWREFERSVSVVPHSSTVAEAIPNEDAGSEWQIFDAAVAKMATESFESTTASLSESHVVPTTTASISVPPGPPPMRAPPGMPPPGMPAPRVVGHHPHLNFPPPQPPAGFPPPGSKGSSSKDHQNAPWHQFNPPTQGGTFMPGKMGKGVAQNSLRYQPAVPVRGAPAYGFGAGGGAGGALGAESEVYKKLTPAGAPGDAGRFKPASVRTVVAKVRSGMSEEAVEDAVGGVQIGRSGVGRSVGGFGFERVVL